MNTSLPALPASLPPSAHIPSDLPPALVGLIWRKGELAENDLIATMVDLVRRGVLRVELVPRQGRPQAPPCVASGSIFDVQTHLLTLDRDKLDELAPFEAEIVRALFHLIVQDDCITADQYRAEFRNNFDWFAAWFRDWRHLVYADPRAKGLISIEGLRHADSRKSLLAGTGLVNLIMVAIATGVLMLCAFIGALAWVGVGGGLLGLAVTIAAVAGVVIWSLRRPAPDVLTARGFDLSLRYTALRDYLRDVSHMQDMPPEGVILWDEYLSLAVVFGLGDRIVGDLFVLSPNSLQKLGLEYTFYSPGLEDGGVGEGAASDAARRRFAREHNWDQRMKAIELGGPAGPPPGPSDGTL